MRVRGTDKKDQRAQTRKGKGHRPERARDTDQEGQGAQTKKGEGHRPGRARATSLQRKVACAKVSPYIVVSHLRFQRSNTT